MSAAGALGAGVLGALSVAPARIAFTGWGLRYPDRDGWAVRGLDLVVEPGERVAIVGASGAGKSTVLRAVAGVLPELPDVHDGDDPDHREGVVTVDGANPEDVRGRIGLVMQDPEAHTVMSRIGDDVAFGCENLGVPRDEIPDRVRRALDVVGLDLPLGGSTEAMSGGQRQRLALAGVLAMRPGALVLDEPCANLDPDGVRQVHDAVRDVLAETGATLLVVEHRIGTWLDLVDRLVVLEPGGGVVADGTPARVLADHGELLTRAGVWVPGLEVTARRPAASGASGAPLLGAVSLGTARVAGTLVGEGIDCTLHAGEVVAIVGPNGVGKSTLGLTLGGLLEPAAGMVVAADRLADGATPRRRGVAADTAPSDWSSLALAARIGSVFQDPAHQFVARSVWDELAVGPRAQGLPEDEVAAAVDEVLDAFGLRALEDADPFTLSGGEQRRLAIGSVVIGAPPVVVLDEPTSGQDRTTWQAIVDRLGALADAGSAVVVVTHDAALVDALGARTLELAPATPHGPGRTPERPALPAQPVPPVRPALRVNPAASLVGVLTLAVCLVTSLDVVSAATALLGELILLPLARVPLATLLRRMAPLVVAGPLAGLGIALYGRVSGQVLVDVGFVTVSTGSLVLAIATVLRLLAIALPTVALFARVDPTDLADGLAQVLRLPARFVLGALAAVRMIGGLAGEWRQLALARRARGIGDRGRIRGGASMAFSLLVIALRRGTALAVAMESRGFGAPTPRTWAREVRFGVREWTLIGVTTALGLVAIGAAVVAGTWHGV